LTEENDALVSNVHFLINFTQKMLNFCSNFFCNALVDVEKKLQITSSIYKLSSENNQHLVWQFKYVFRN